MTNLPPAAIFFIGAILLPLVSAPTATGCLPGLPGGRFLVAAGSAHRRHFFGQFSEATLW